jgi:hypothetical protein
MARTLQTRSMAIMVIGLVLGLVYAIITLAAPLRTNTYHLSGGAVFWLDLTIIVPIFAIWLVALRGTSRLHDYALLIGDNADGRAVRIVALGLFVVIGGFIADAISGGLRTYFVGSESMRLVVIFKNHLPVAMNLIGFFMIWRGARQLGGVSGKPVTFERMVVIVFPYLVLFSLFGWYYYFHIDHALVNGIPNFSLGGTLPFYSIAVPSIVTWILGIISIIHISNYARRVRGKIYRWALRDLAYGLATVIGFSTAIQILNISSNALTHWQIGPVLLLIYVLLVIYAAGFVLIDRGARKLILIEVVA